MLNFFVDLSKEYSQMEVFAIGLAFFLAIIIALSFHEFAHAFVAHKSGDNTPKAQGRLTLNPLKHISPLGMLTFFLFGFGWAKPVEVNPLKFRNYKKSMALVSMAGIIANIILAFLSGIFYGLLIAFAGPVGNYLHLAANYFFYFSCILNVSLAVFNLLPIYPLDGFKFLEVFLKADNKFLKFMYQYGQIVLLVFILTPIFDILFSLIVSGVLSVIFLIPALFI